MPTTRSKSKNQLETKSNKATSKSEAEKLVESLPKCFVSLGRMESTNNQKLSRKNRSVRFALDKCGDDRRSPSRNRSTAQNHSPSNRPSPNRSQSSNRSTIQNCSPSPNRSISQNRSPSQSSKELFNRKSRSDYRSQHRDSYHHRSYHHRSSRHRSSRRRSYHRHLRYRSPSSSPDDYRSYRRHRRYRRYSSSPSKDSSSDTASDYSHRSRSHDRRSERRSRARNPHNPLPSADKKHQRVQRGTGIDSVSGEFFLYIFHLIYGHSIPFTSIILMFFFQYSASSVAVNEKQTNCAKRRARTDSVSAPPMKFSKVDPKTAQSQSAKQPAKRRIRAQSTMGNYFANFL